MREFRRRMPKEKAKKIKEERATAYRSERAAAIQAFWEAQGGRCYLCSRELVFKEERRVHLDHDHRCCKRGNGCSTCQRGLACLACNLLVGYGQDDPERIHLVADNLAAARTLVEQRMAAAAEAQPALWEEGEIREQP